MSSSSVLPSTPEEKLLCARGEDLALLSEKTGRTAATKFLTPAESAFLKRYCRSAGIGVFFDGGRADCERTVALFLPPWARELDPEELIPRESPVRALRITNSAGAELSHRDYLGALMASGIRRDTVGDIDVHGSEAYVFCLEDVCRFISEELEFAGRARLSVEQIGREDVPPPEKEEGQPLYGTVSSLRLDGLIAEGFRLSREEAKLLVAQGACSVDHVLCQKPDLAVDEGALISVKGRGRLRFDRIRGETRRGRIGVELTLFGRQGKK